jgi:hypothetical protein
VKVAEWEGTVEAFLDAENPLIRIEGPIDKIVEKGDRVRVTVERIMNDYPGQAFFHAHNANIRRAEENWERSHP